MKIPQNPRQPTNSNPIKIRRMILYPDNLIYKNQQYSYSEISKLEFDWNLFKDLVPGSIWDLKMQFNLDGVQKRIKLKTVDNLFINISMKKFEEFFCGYHYMATKSFEARYNSYINEFNEKGYFRYDDSYLFMKDRVTDGKDYEEILSDGTKYLQRHKHGILLISKEHVEANFIAKMLSPVPNMVGAFTSDVDIDVLEKIFEEFYGLKLEISFVDYRTQL